LLLAIRASRQAVKEGLGESDIQRALEIERSFEKLYSSVDSECYAGRILMGWRNVNRTNRSAKVIDNNNAVLSTVTGFKNWPAGSNHPICCMIRIARQARRSCSSRSVSGDRLDRDNT
jgi:hypothetical protein